MTKEEKEIINSITVPFKAKDYPEVHSDILYIYNKFKPILPHGEVVMTIIKFMNYKYKNYATEREYKDIPVERWYNWEWGELMFKHLKCSNPDCDWVCDMDSAIDYHYCPKCGFLLPYREAVLIISESDYNQLSQKADESGWAKIKKSLF